MFQAIRTPSSVLTTNKTKLLTATVLTVASSAIWTSGGVALAQDESVDTKRDEIIVTSRKREESLQDVPLSVSVLDSETLELKGVVNFFDYGSSIPNLSFGNTGDGFFTSRSIQVRGIEGRFTTGLYIDDLPMPESIDPRVIDLDRIEVLRGPQGSLYGAQALGGVVRLVTKQADPNDTTARIHVQGADVKGGATDYAVDGSVNIPLVEDKLGVRATAYYQRQGGFFDRIVDNPNIVGDEFTDENFDNVEAYGGIIAATWQPLDWLSFQPKFIYQKTVFDGLPYADIDPSTTSITRGNDFLEQQEEEFWIAGSVISADFDFGTVTSSTSFFNRETSETEDVSEVIDLFLSTGLAPAFFLDEQELETVTQELRFVSDFGGPFEVTAGFFYSDQDQTGFIPPLMAEGVPLNLFSRDIETSIREIALFGELTYFVTDKLSVSAGGRWFDNKFDSFRAGDGIFNGGPSEDIGLQEESDFNPSASISYEHSDNLTVYFRGARGFRVGGINSALPDSCDADLNALGISESPTDFDSDELWSYEIGGKAATPDNRYSVNAAVYYVDWDGLPQSVALTGCGFRITDNTASARSQGFELEFFGAPTDELDFSFGVGFTDAEITDPGNTTAVSKGDPFQNVPRWNVNTSGQYTHPISTELDAYGRADYRYVGESVSTNNSSISDPRIRDAYEILDFRFGVRSGPWDASAFVKNALDERANLSDNTSLAVETPGRPRILVNRPRTIGVSLRGNF